MIKFMLVESAPKELAKGEHFIASPDFLDEIRRNKAKAGRNGLTGVNHLRYIVDTIGMKYDPQGTNAWSVRPHAFEGRPYSSDEELSQIVIEMLNTQYPRIFSKVLDHQLINLPKGTELVIIEENKAPSDVLQIFAKNGIIQVSSEQVPEKTKKNKKIKEDSTENL